MESTGGGRVIVVIPTYNERDNLEPIVGRVRAAVPDAHVLVVDDASPDGTGAVADALAEADEHVHVMHRTAKDGLGAAYIAGFHWALERGYDVLVEMDADGSHQPEQLPSLLAALPGADLVIGSRWVPGGSVQNWPLRRQLLSRGANLFVKIMLGMPVGDATAGFRAYKASTLAKIGLDDVESQGYCFQVDLTRRTVGAGLLVAEVPIRFVERTRGASKMSGAVMREALLRITQWGIAYRLDTLTGRRRAGR
ncbi:MAG: glycosyltransferase [Streptosporangiales bacterium]|nr:glycosyltransferase [Streptosporangiales bacterium]